MKLLARPQKRMQVLLENSSTNRYSLDNDV